MTSNRLVSVIIPVYNSAKYITDAIDSVLAQTYKNYEIIIVNDGSTDSTAEVVKKYLRSQILDHRPQAIRYVYQENKGPSAARNRGIKEAKGEYIAFLDSDDVWLPEKIELQMAEILKSPSLGLITCGEINVNLINSTEEYSYGLRGLNRNKALNLLLLKNIIHGGSPVLIRKECLDRVGLFDEKLQVAEDWDLWLRICRHYDFKGIDKPLVKILIRENSQCSDGYKNIINEIRFLDKVFSDSSFKKNWIIKKKAYGLRYYAAAIAFRENGKISDTKKYLLKAISTFPLAFADKTRLFFTFCTIFGFYKKG